MPPAPAKAPWCEMPCGEALVRDALAASERGGLHAGFGNRSKDAWAYSHAGVPPAMVLIIDPASRLVQQQELVRVRVRLRLRVGVGVGLGLG